MDFYTVILTRGTRAGARGGIKRHCPYCCYLPPLAFLCEMVKRKRVGKTPAGDVDAAVVVVERKDKEATVEDRNHVDAKEPTADECPSPNEVRLRSVEDSRWKRQYAVSVLFIAFLLYMFMPLMFAGIPTDPKMTAYIQEARLANGQRGDDGEPQQVIVATLCNMRKVKTSYILQTLTAEGVAHFRYRIKPATCAHVTISTEAGTDHFDSCQLFLYEVNPSTWYFGVQHDFKDAHVAVARTQK